MNKLKSFVLHQLITGKANSVQKDAKQWKKKPVAKHSK